MARFACPVCHDPNAYPFWLDSEPPAGCPEEPDLRPGYGICSFKLEEAKRAALWRKIAPECFDERGNILPDGLEGVLKKLETYKP